MPPLDGGGKEIFGRSMQTKSRIEQMYPFRGDQMPPLWGGGGGGGINGGGGDIRAKYADEAGFLGPVNVSRNFLPNWNCLQKDLNQQHRKTTLF